MEETAQFDSTLGGSEQLPEHINLPRFVARRAHEIQLMRHTLTTQNATKLAFQTLPKHMRRRAMSHNVKRLPRRLRQIHRNQMEKSGNPTSTKRPSRKYRRRPVNLTVEYEGRSATNRWLRTHIWHAKRFHMVNKWGYRIPCHAREKSFRANYRALTQYTLMQDISYVHCAEISAPNREVITEKLKLITSTNAALTIGAKTFISGGRECQLILFDEEKREIGSIQANWCPESTDNSHKLWLWIHAAFYSQALKTLTGIFQLSAVDSNIYRCDTTGVALQELQSDLSRFRLIGPTSMSVLQKTLRTVFQYDPEQKTWLNLYLERNDLANVQAQGKTWSELVSNPEVIPNSIHGLVVHDPRCKNIQETNDQDGQESPKSPLWHSEYRNATNAEESIATKKLIRMRHDKLVPGTELTASGYYIPVILINQPGCQQENLGFGSGWDVILPSAWSRHFWTALIMNGARVGGLRENKNLLFEMGRMQFFQPNTKAGIQEDSITTEECRKVFFKRPPNKRTNFSKFNIAKPFEYDWPLLLSEWSNDNDKAALTIDEIKVVGRQSTLDELQSWLQSKIKTFPDISDKHLIPVRIISGGKGCPNQFSLICLPKNKNDLKDVINEPKSFDKNRQERRELRQSHAKHLRKLRRARKKNRNDKLEHDRMLKEYQEKMRKLWLPTMNKLRNSCAREVMGMVQKGGFRYSIGKPCGIGYITPEALKQLRKSGTRNNVLFRNTNSRLYHRARLEIVTD